MLNDPNEDPRDEDDIAEDENNRCGDVDRDEVAHLLVEDDGREELSGFLSW